MSYHQDALKIAIAYAEVFSKAADRELRNGDPVKTDEAREQLMCALRALDTYNPNIDQPSSQPYPEVPYGPAGKRVCYDGIPSHALIPAPGTEPSMTAVAQMIHTVDRAKREIFALRNALMQVKERGTEDDPCWCAHAGNPRHDPYCETARGLLIAAPLREEDQ